MSRLKLVLLVILAAPALAQAVLFAKPSLFAGKVVVVEQGGYRILRFHDQGHDSEQSRCEIKRPNYLVHEYTRLQLLGLTFLEKPPERILVIGLGGASLTKALHALYPEAQVDSVEIDPVVVEAARRFFFYREGPKVRTFVQDARQYVLQTRERYDIVFLDAFDGLDVPEALRTRQFYRDVAALLESDGSVVVANLHKNSDTYASDRNTLASVFGQTCAFAGVGNVLLVNRLRPGSCDILEAAARLAPEYDLVRYARMRDTSDWDRTAPLITGS